MKTKNFKIVLIFIFIFIILFQFTRIKSLKKENEKYQITLNILIKDAYSNLSNISDELTPILSNAIKKKYFTEEELLLATDLIKNFSDCFCSLSTSIETYINKYNIDYNTQEPFSFVANRLYIYLSNMRKVNFYKKAGEKYIIPDNKVKEFNPIINILTNINEQRRTIVNITIGSNKNIIKNDQWIEIYESIIKNIFEY